MAVTSVTSWRSNAIHITYISPGLRRHGTETGLVVAAETADREYG